MNRTFLSFLFAFLLSATSGCFFSSRISHGEKAGTLRAEGMHDEAVEEYLLHIEERLASKTRPEFENPYFYYLLIGDTYLSSERLEEAIAAYEEAERREVRAEFVIDRYRQVGRWLEEEERYEDAIEFLKKHRDLEPLLFDFDIDKLHRKLVAEEYGETFGQP